MVHGGSLDASFSGRFYPGLFCPLLHPATAATVRASKTLSACSRQRMALEHVRVIDGTGAAAKVDQTIVIAGGKITAIGNAGAVPVPADAPHRYDRLFRAAWASGHA